jgi:hypothetical protein
VAEIVKERTHVEAGHQKKQNGKDKDRHRGMFIGAELCSR